MHTVSVFDSIKNVIPCRIRWAGQVSRSTAFKSLAIKAAGLPPHPSAIGWSDFALFAIFEKRHISADQVF